ncbi:helix-turn-helix domain-containing protein [Pseudomonas sp. NA-150]|uniref:helix-turn-helix domain-containing protein n=1 Tax=Pseudomonas sp. NA-150 TaxID=3367525 RepID=UPI0037CB42A7
MELIGEVLKVMPLLAEAVGISVSAIWLCRYRLHQTPRTQGIDLRTTEKITLSPLAATGDGKRPVGFGLNALDDHARRQGLAQLHQVAKGPADTTRLKRLLGSNLLFGAPYNSLSFSVEDCSIALPTADPALDVLHVEYARTRLNQRLNGSMTARVRRVLSERLAQGVPSDLDKIAQVVGVSARSQQRRLGNEDMHFSLLHDEARLMLAHNFLRNSLRSMKYIGALLGFRDQSSVHKACIRWFGMTPGRYREVFEAESLDRH